MKTIIRAVLDSNLPEIRRIMAGEPEAAWTMAESGRTPIQVAYSMKNYPAIAAILRHTPRCIEEIPTKPPELLCELIADFSRSTLCSGWNQDIEFDLWALVIGDHEYKRDYDRYLTIDRDSLSDIGWIASWAEGWFHWSDSDDAPNFISTCEWEELYKKQKRRR